MRRFVSAAISALSITGITTEACMLKARAVDGQPWPNASYAIVWPRKLTPPPPMSRGTVSARKPSCAQPVVILGRVRGVAVVPSRAGREIGGEREAALPQFAVLVAEPQNPLCPPPRRPARRYITRMLCDRDKATLS